MPVFPERVTAIAGRYEGRSGTIDGPDGYLARLRRKGRESIPVFWKLPGGVRKTEGYKISELTSEMPEETNFPEYVIAVGGARMGGEGRIQGYVGTLQQLRDKGEVNVPVLWEQVPGWDTYPIAALRQD